jgi:membrane protease YdiL (CAAX protease family)
LEAVDRGRFRVASIAGPIAVGYGLAASLAVGLTLALRDGVPWEHPAPWLRLQPLEATALSAFLGLVLAVAVVVATRLTVWRFSWAQRLHLELRPIARGLVLWHVVIIAFFSSLGEELVFRGLVQPWLGLLPTAVVFGLCHQMPGPARWVWVCWATTVGLAFGAIFQASGSLVGPLLAHAVINAVNLAFLRDHDPLASSSSEELGAS